MFKEIPQHHGVRNPTKNVLPRYGNTLFSTKITSQACRRNRQRMPICLLRVLGWSDANLSLQPTADQLRGSTSGGVSKDCNNFALGNNARNMSGWHLPWFTFLSESTKGQQIAITGALLGNLLNRCNPDSLSYKRRCSRRRTVVNFRATQVIGVKFAGDILLSDVGVLHILSAP